MAPSSHPALDPERVERLLKAAKTEPVPFAFARDPKSETGILAVDKTRTGKALLELCRKETGAKKGAYGTVSIEGVNATFLCERNELSQLAKALLGWFKAQKLSLKVSVSEGEDAADEGEGEEQAGKTQEKAEETGEGRRPQARAPEASEEDAGQDDAEEEEDQEEDIPEGKMFDPAVIVPLIRRAKKRPRPFAFGIGPDIDLLAVHPKADPMRLARKVREEGAKKGIWGRVSMDGAIAIFTCEKEPFSGARKGLKRWIKQQGLTLKFRLNGPDGEFIDPEDDEAESQASEGPGNAGLAALAERLAALLPALKERAGDPARRDFIRQTYAACDAAIKAGKADEAEVGLRTLEEYAAIAVSDTPADDEDVPEGPGQQAQLRISDFDAILEEINDALDILRPLAAYPGSAPELAAALANLATREANFTALGVRRTQALLDEQAQNFPALQAHIDAALAELRSLRHEMGHQNIPITSGAQDTPEHRRAILNTLFNQLDPRRQAAETDRDVFEVLLAEAGARADNIRNDLQARLARLWGAVKTLGGNTPLAREIEPISDITAEADALPAQNQMPRKLELWTSALVQAGELITRATPLGTLRSATRNALHVARQLLDQTPDSLARQDITVRLEALTGQLRTEALAATDCADLAVRWAAVRDTANVVRADALRLKKLSVSDATLESDLRALVDLCTSLLPLRAIIGPADWPAFVDPTAAYSDAHITAEVQKAGDARVALREEIDANLTKAWALKIGRLDYSGLPALMDERRQQGDILPEGVEGQAFWTAAFEKKYGLKLSIPPGMEMKKFPKLYELFARVPRGHVGHDQLNNLDYEVAAGSAFYSKNQTKINLSHVDRPLPPEKQDQFKYPVTDGSPDSYHDYFTMITLHEIGHAADAKNSLMSLQTAGLGEWKDWTTETLTAVTDAVAGEIALAMGANKDDLLAAVRQALVTGTIDKPVGPNAPFGHLHAQWPAFEPLIDQYKVIALATTKEPWTAPLVVTAGRCYHEAYPGRWVSYREADRTGGTSVSAYQWRAPGEWFAELYAWYWFGDDETERARREARLPAAIKDAIMGTAA